jgi:hypothetical protein
MTRPVTDLHPPEEMIRLGWALLSATYGEAELGYDLDELHATYSLEQREEAWSLACGLLLRFLADHGERAGCNCGSAAWLQHVMEGEADHG